MKFNEATNCPVCGTSDSTKLIGVVPLFDDARSDIVMCDKCQARWRINYKMSEIGVEFISKGIEPDENVEAEQPSSKN